MTSADASASTGMTLGSDEIKLARTVEDAINNLTAFEFLDITFYEGTNGILVNIIRKG